MNSTLCFSGHRYYTGGEMELARLLDAVHRAYADGFRIFISGMAPGFDLAAAEVALTLPDDIKLIAAIPFPDQARTYSAEDRARYNALLPLCEVHILADRYSHGCYYRRDEWMVARARRIVCWFDGTRKSSGTRYTVSQAAKSGLEIVNLFSSLF